ncbi:hypothetical protein GGI19_000093 [Coemansia pectinata]|uniref:Xylanolytic transcriptional activator regulatory domain-containing protein n=1 Tax=Coemansia pectinata TaxID=1052879 RepID=A0A9W8H1J6_9FUNG|nr:hypothetical protein GGI19_000093 [Coemansia pectinata]
MDMLAGMSSDPNPAAQTMQNFQRSQFQHASQQPQQSHYQPQYQAQQQYQPQQQQRFMSPAENHAAFTNVFLSSINAAQQQNSQQQTYQQQAYQQQEFHARQPLLFGSSTPPSLAMHQRQAQAQTLGQHQPPMVFRSLSANSSAFDGSSLALSPSSSSLSMVAAASMRTSFVSPIALGSMLPPTSPTGVSNMSAAAAAAAAAAVAAFQFSSPPPPPSSSSSGMLAVANGNNGRSQQEQEVAALLANHSHPSMLSVRLSASSATQPMPLSFSADIGAASCLTSPIAAGFPPTPITAAGPAAAGTAGTASSSSGAKPRRTRSRQGSVGSRPNNAATPSIASLAATMRRHPGGRRIGSSRKRSGGDWSRSTIEEELVLDGLSAEGADNFGRPLFDVSTYPLPAHADLDEHMNGTFEYFYIGVQTMHEVTFRKRIAGGNVSPVLIYAIMAIASRYSRRPSLHSLNGMAFLNGDRHASTACGLTSVLLNHGELGTVDNIHGMLFLSVYFMGQGNMLKSRIYLVKAVCTARTMGFQNMDATFVPSSPMIAFRGNFDKPQDLSALHPRACSCPKTIEDRVALETKRRIWWFLVFVDYFTANVMNVPLEIPPDSYCVRLPCSDEEWRSPTLTKGTSDMPGVADGSNAGAIIDGLSFAHASAGLGYSSPLPDSNVRANAPCDLGFGDRQSSAKQGRDYLRLNGFHDCRPPWLYHPGAFYLERLMIEFCDHLRRLNNLRSLAIRSFFHAEPVFVDEAYPYLKRRRQNSSWIERLNKVKSSWSWLHMQVNKWLDSILLRFSEEINRVPSDQYNRQYRHQYYYYLIAAHSTIIMSHGVILQLYTDFSRYIRQQQQQYEAYEQQARTQPPTPTQGHSAFATGLSDAAARSSGGGHGATIASSAWGPPGVCTPSIDYGVGGLSLSEGLSEFAIGTLGSAVTPLINIAQSLAASGGGSSVHGSSAYGSVIGSPVTNPNGNVLPTQANFDDMLHSDIEMGDATSRFGGMSASSLGLSFISPGPPSSSNPVHSVLNGPNAAINILGDLAEMAVLAWNGCVSTAEQLALILRGKHPKFVLLGSPPLDVFREQVLSGDANILSLPGSAFNAPGTGPGADNPILSDPDFYMRLQPSTAWWMFLVAQVQVGHIKRLLKESEGSFKVSEKRKALAAKRAKAAARAAAKAAGEATPTEDPAVVTSGEPMDQSGNMDAEDDAAACLDRATEEQLLGTPQRQQRPVEQMRPLSTNVNNSAIILASAVNMSNSAPPAQSREEREKNATRTARASRLVRAYENLSCMVKVLEGMQQYWQCMDYVKAIQDILRGSEDPLH